MARETLATIFSPFCFSIREETMKMDGETARLSPKALARSLARIEGEGLDRDELVGERISKYQLLYSNS